MMHVELKFPVIGTTLPADHAYAMYSAISRLVPEAHSADWLAIETVQGAARGDGATQLNERAKMRMRCPQDRVPLLLKLAGKRLELDAHALRLGVPQIFLLKPSASLYARCVTIKNHTEPESFLTAVAHKLDELGVIGVPELGARRVVRINGHTVVGFSLSIHELSDEGSLVLQERGIGGRRRMGCGYFNPISRENQP